MRRGWWKGCSIQLSLHGNPFTRANAHAAASARIRPMVFPEFLNCSDLQVLDEEDLGIRDASGRQVVKTEWGASHHTPLIASQAPLPALPVGRRHRGPK